MKPCIVFTVYFFFNIISLRPVHLWNYCMSINTEKEETTLKKITLTFDSHIFSKEILIQHYMQIFGSYYLFCIDLFCVPKSGVRPIVSQKKRSVLFQDSQLLGHLYLAMRLRKCYARFESARTDSRRGTVRPSVCLPFIF